MTYETVQIRQFLKDAFSDEDLTTLCFDHFRDVYESFSAGMTKTQKIQLLIEHCQRRGTMTDLIAVLAQTRPAQFQQFFGGATPQQVAQQVRSAPLPVDQKRRIDFKWWAAIIVALLACIAAWLVVPEFRQMLTNISPLSATVPTPVPTNIVLPSPTLTQIPPTATSTATLEPSPTVAPSPTPTVAPQPTATPSCPLVGGMLSNIWQTVQAQIGCERGAVRQTLIAEENFQRGKMFYREVIDKDLYQAVALLNDGTWRIAQIDRPFREGIDPEYSCRDANTPASSPPTPRNGFGLIWCLRPDIRDLLGNATDPERGYNGYVQEFDRGFVFRTDTGLTYVFYDNGRWERP